MNETIPVTLLVTLPIQLTSTQREQLEELAEMHSLTLPDYLQALVQREIVMLGTLHERHPHLFGSATITD